MRDSLPWTVHADAGSLLRPQPTFSSNGWSEKSGRSVDGLQLQGNVAAGGEGVCHIVDSRLVLLSPTAALVQHMVLLALDGSL